MQHRQHGKRKDNAMQPLPAPAKIAHPTIGRGQRQHQKPQHRHEADGQIKPPADLLNDLAQHAILIDHIQRHMQPHPAQRAQAQHPPQLKQPRPFQHPPHGCDGQADQQKAQRPAAGEMGDLLQIAEFIMQPIPDRQEHGQQHQRQGGDAQRAKPAAPVPPGNEERRIRQHRSEQHGRRLRPSRGAGFPPQPARFHPAPHVAAALARREAPPTPQQSAPPPGRGAVAPPPQGRR